MLRRGYPRQCQRNTKARNPLLGPPCAVKAACTVTTGGMGKHRSCCASCPYPLGKPPRSRAWLRDHMVSLNEVESTYGECSPCLNTLPDGTVQWREVLVSFTTLAMATLGAVVAKRLARMNLIYPVPTEGACDNRYRLADNHHLSDLVESVKLNLGGPSDDGNESGSRRVETPPKSSDASEGSQRGHSSRSTGKPCTWRRATA
jgi:hypothetical protein